MNPGRALAARLAKSSHPPRLVAPTNRDKVWRDSELRDLHQTRMIVATAAELNGGWSQRASSPQMQPSLEVMGLVALAPVTPEFLVLDRHALPARRASRRYDSSASVGPFGGTCTDFRSGKGSSFDKGFTPSKGSNSSRGLTPSRGTTTSKGFNNSNGTGATTTPTAFICLRIHITTPFDWLELLQATEAFMVLQQMELRSFVLMADLNGVHDRLHPLMTREGMEAAPARAGRFRRAVVDKHIEFFGPLRIDHLSLVLEVMREKLDGLWEVGRRAVREPEWIEERYARHARYAMV
ncbi:hypothetical protein HRG_003588 [Hirsutella rhossiliensis]|uniref:Uncharacterized protein n=1 Tax=Hirsutella rhossiliensis TaxID=111463 RepID=A0A9P8N2T1_9HYPO|nr:uncharacterized protein HRG_03588 [Hirsutella rhossiliensis]KAH0965572.1 hypothetical protein HRG_03588 [Hirsutella rhossiliensis]